MLLAPEPLREGHRLDAFNSGEPALDDWLKRRARTNQTSGATRTYVVCEEDARVVGYYGLAFGALALSDAPGPIRRNMPDPIPIAILGRLAVDLTWQGRGLGVALLQDAVLRTRAAADILGLRGLVVHALSDAAKAFYEHHGFIASPTRSMLLVLSVR